MIDISATELRRNLSIYLAKIRRGGRVRVTLRGKSTAEIVPPNSGQAPQTDARARLQGIVTRYERPLDPVLATNE